MTDARKNRIGKSVYRYWPVKVGTWAVACARNVEYDTTCFIATSGIKTKKEAAKIAKEMEEKQDE